MSSVDIPEKAAPPFPPDDPVNSQTQATPDVCHLRALLHGPGQDLRAIPFSLLFKLLFRKCRITAAYLRAFFGNNFEPLAALLVHWGHYRIAHWFIRTVKAPRFLERKAYEKFFIGDHEDFHRLGLLINEARAEDAARTGLDFDQRHYLGPFYGDTIGYIALLGYYIQMQRLWGPPGVKNIFCLNPKRIANRHLFGYMAPFLDVVTDPAIQKTYRPALEHMQIVSLVRAQGEWKNFYVAASQAHIQWAEQKLPPLLQLRNEDVEYGWENLAILGVPKGNWFVILHVRESGFYRGTASESTDKIIATRNASIDDYLPAAREIIARGGFVIRIGDPSMKPLPADIPGLIDYAHSPLKSERMDVFLFGAARFFLCTNSGPSAVPGHFGIPCLHTNWLPLSHHYGHPHDILLPRLVEDCSTGRILTFEEMISSRVGHALAMTPEDDGFRYLPNTPEELLEGVRDMFEALENGTVRRREQQRHMDSFIQLCQKHQFRWQTTPCGSFLMRHRHLL